VNHWLGCKVISKYILLEKCLCSVLNDFTFWGHLSPFLYASSKLHMKSKGKQN
jgi:hypothetical protein